MVRDGPLGQVHLGDDSAHGHALIAKKLEKADARAAAKRATKDYEVFAHIIEDHQ